MAITSQNAPVFHGIKLAGNSAVENLAVSVVASDPTATVGGKVWVVDAVADTSDQALRYSYVDQTGAVQTAQVSTKADLDAEVSRAKGVEGTLSSLTTTNKTSLVNAINSEVSRAKGAEGTVDFSGATGVATGNDSSELTTLQGTTNLAAAILATNARAVASEDDLQVQIDNLLTNTDATALNSLSEIVAAYQAKDSDLDGAISELASDRANALADVLGSGFTYVAPVRDANGVITTPATVELLIDGIDTDITNAFIKVKTDYEAQDNVIEASVGLQTDGSLSFTAFDAETMQIDLTSETSILAAIEAINTELKVGGSDALDAEILRAQTAEGDLDFSTTSFSTAADLTAAIIAEYTRATTKETALQTEIDNTQAAAGSAIADNGTFAGYTGTNYINSATSMTNADTLLDTEIKTTDTNSKNRDDAIEAGAGLSAAGAFVTRTGSNYIDAGTSLHSVDTLLDSAIKSEETARISQDDVIETGAGLEDDGTYAAIGVYDQATNATGGYFIQAATSLKDADFKLDHALKAEEVARKAQDDVIEAGAGLETDGTYSAIGAYNATTNASGGHYIGAASSLKNADKLLDTALKAEEDARIAQDNVIEASVGLNADGTFNTYTATNYLNATTTVRGAISTLDAKIKEITDLNSESAADVLLELNTTQTSLGTMINGTDGSWTGFTGTNYLNDSLTTTGALTALDTAINDEVVARKNDDQDIIDAINAGNYYVASPAATTHTITHNLASDQLIIQVLVDQGDGTYANDIVPIAIDTNNQFTVYLSTSSAIRVSVMRMDDITITVN